MKRSIRFATLLVAVFCAYVLSANAQDGTFVASVSDTKVPAAQQFTLTFTFTGSDMNAVKNFTPPDFGAFVVIAGPSQSTNMQWINGRTSASISFTYTLYARQKGKSRIGPASIEYRGAKIQSQPLTMEVTAASAQTAKQAGQQPDAAIGDNLFIRATVDKQRVRQGEQLTVTYKLYTRLAVSSYELKPPSFDGFWGEDFDMPPQPVLSNETVNGKSYRAAVIKKTALFATQPGNLKVAPLSVRCAVQVQAKRRGNDLFDSFFNDPFFQQVQTASYDFTSNAIPVTVDPLPVNSPSGFSGSVGTYSFSASIDRSSVKAGDPITLRVTVSGTGNIRLVTLPKPALPSDIESYEPKISEDVNREGGAIRGKKTAEYLLIPRNAGHRTIEPMTFSWFDPGKRDYLTTRSQQFDLNIAPGKDFASGDQAGMSKEDVRLLGDDIRFLKLSMGDVRPVGETHSDVLPLVLGLVIPPALFVASWGYRKRRMRLNGDITGVLFQAAGRNATKRLKKAQALLEQGNAEQFHAEVLRALTLYLEHKLRLAKATFSTEDALARLRAHKVPDNIGATLRSCIERAEYARYAPSADSAETRKDLLETVARTITGIDRTYGRGEKQS